MVLDPPMSLDTQNIQTNEIQLTSIALCGIDVTMTY